MEIEILQSLILSWLRNIKKCQMVQTNWKTSSKWELKHKEVLERIIQNSSNVFKAKYGYNLHKGNSSIQQLLAQTGIDLIGILFNDNKEHIYAIDVDFYDDKLNHGTKDETTFRVIKRCIRTAMCMYGYFGVDNGTIIFATPKINPSVINDINACANDIVPVLKGLGLNYKIIVIANEDFMDNVLKPVIEVLDNDTEISELSMKNLQIYKLFAEKPLKIVTERNTTQREISLEFDAVDYNDIDGLEKMKIGIIVRTVFCKMLKDGDVSKEEIYLMQTKVYSKETFDIQFPLLQKACITNGISPKRYYSLPIKIHGESYFLCSEWYEVPANNHRPYLLKWFALHKNQL